MLTIVLFSVLLLTQDNDIDLCCLYYSYGSVSSFTMDQSIGGLCYIYFSSFYLLHYSTVLTCVNYIFFHLKSKRILMKRGNFEKLSPCFLSFMIKNFNSSHSMYKKFYFFVNFNLKLFICSHISIFLVEVFRCSCLWLILNDEFN